MTTMDHLRVLRILAVSLGCVGIVLPAPALEAAPPVSRGAIPTAPIQGKRLVGDVELDAAGWMDGQVFHGQGLPVAGVPVVLRRLGHEVGRTRTDAAGRFRFGPLRGGMYELSAGEHGRVVRAWAATTAPPGSNNVTLIVIGDAVRGQMPLKDFFASDVVIICALVAALIAVPIAVSHSGPSSP